MLEVQSYLRSHADKTKATSLDRFFKTAPGQYGHGDKFLGGFNTPTLRAIALKYLLNNKRDLTVLFKSPYHEERLVGVYMLVRLYQQNPKKDYVQWYLDLKEGLNNWDLVDASTYFILGDYSQRTKDLSFIKSLAQSSRHWDKRMAMVSTFAFIKKKEVDLTYQLAKKFLKDKEDLMHKATGWMLREAGKRDLKKLEKFIHIHGKQMPRTMLRYAIEKFPPKKRLILLKNTR